MAGEADQPVEILEEQEMDTIPTPTAAKDKLSPTDSLNLEAGRSSMNETHPSKMGWRTTLILAFQSIGIVYGDIGTSPLYMYSSTFTDGKIQNKDDILGVLSLIIYTIVFIPMLKYVFIVLWANDNGNGGAFALYSLISRHAKVRFIPNEQPEDRELSNYKLETPSSSEFKRAHKLKHFLESSHFARILLLLATILGTSMVIGDGILTPSISVLSAVGGISSSLGQDAVVGMTIAILVFLFCVQRFGTDKVGISFAPILLVWFTFIGGIGLYNLFKYDVGVLRAVNPKYIYDYFKRNGKQGWLSLGGVFLCITGSEAMFADLGHFSVRAIQISFSFAVFPAILLAYCGQSAFLRVFPDKVGNTFYATIPKPLYWPTFVVAVMAAIIASQAMISGAFSIIMQALSLGCFPRVTVVHTSTKHHGQVYIPEVNYIFMVASIIVCAAFKTTENISHAYGIAVVGDMLITTSLVSLIILVVWKKSIWQAALFWLIFGSIESVYFTSQLTKFTEGGFLPIVSAMFLTSVMGIWHYVHKERYMFELKNKVSSQYLREELDAEVVSRVPGVGLLYSELVQGIPPIFPHLIRNISSIHSVLIFVSIKAIPVTRVDPEERFLFRQVEPREYRIYRCVVRHGYNDRRLEEDTPAEFEAQLMHNLKAFIIQQEPSRRSSSNSLEPVHQGAEEEIEFIERAMEKRVVYMLGEAEVVAHPNSSIINKIVVNYAYNFLKKNFRQAQMAIPRRRLLKVGMTYEI